MSVYRQGRQNSTKILLISAKWYSETTPERKAWLAIQRFAPMREGGAPLEYGALQRLFEVEFGDEVSIRTIQTAIRDAFHDGLVKLQRHALMPEYVRDEMIERALKANFPKLRHVIVANIGSKESDFVHAQLGHALAAHIDRIKTIFRPNDTIAIGSGRAVFRTITALKGFPRVDIGPITINSLTGSVFPQSTMAPASEPL